MDMLERVRQQVSAHKVLYDLPGIERYIPQPRVAEKTFEVIEAVKEVRTSPEQFTSTGYYAIPVYAETFSGDQGIGINVDAFVRGAASMALFCPDSPEMLKDLINGGLEHMYEEGCLPYISEDYMEHILHNMEATLLNNESSHTLHILSYNHGTWWVAGHLTNFNSIKVQNGGGTLNAPQWLEYVLSNRASRAIFDYDE